MKMRRGNSDCCLVSPLHISDSISDYMVWTPSYPTRSIHAADGGIWGGPTCIRALAHIFKRDIVIVDMEHRGCRPRLYSKDLVPNKLGGRSHIHPGFIGRADLLCQVNGNLVLPDTVFDADTLVIAYNGTSHFWSTSLDVEKGTKHAVAQEWLHNKKITSQFRVVDPMVNT